MPKWENLNSFQVQRLIWFFAVVFFVLYLFVTVYSPLLIPFVLGLVFSYMLTPGVNWCENKGLPRGLASALLVLSTIGILALVGVMILPALYHEIIDLIGLMPGVLTSFHELWLPVIREKALKFNIVEPSKLDALVSELTELSAFSGRIQQALMTLWSTAPKVFSTLVNLVMTPLIMFFCLKDYVKWLKSLEGLIPPDLKRPIWLLGARVMKTLRAVLQGQILVAMILALLYILGLSVVGVQGAWAIGLVAGICRLVPYLDVLVGLPLSLISVLYSFQSLSQLLGVLGVFLVVQTLDGMLITPRILGEKAGLHSLVVITSVICFGDHFGFFGVLCAIPLLAVLKVLVTSTLPFYRSSRLYLGK